MQCFNEDMKKNLCRSLEISYKCNGISYTNRKIVAKIIWIAFFMHQIQTFHYLLVKKYNNLFTIVE